MFMKIYYERWLKYCFNRLVTKTQVYNRLIGLLDFLNKYSLKYIEKCK